MTSILVPSMIMVLKMAIAILNSVFSTWSLKVTLLFLFFLYLDLYSTNQDIESGTYRFSDGETDVDGNTFSDSYLVRNYYWQEDKGDEVATIAGGTVKLSRDGENFKFEFDLVTDKNEKIQGSYGGKFEDITGQISAKRIGLPNIKT